MSSGCPSRGRKALLLPCCGERGLPWGWGLRKQSRANLKIPPPLFKDKHYFFLSMYSKHAPSAGPLQQCRFSQHRATSWGYKTFQNKKSRLQPKSNVIPFRSICTRDPALLNGGVGWAESGGHRDSGTWVMLSARQGLPGWERRCGQCQALAACAP